MDLDRDSLYRAIKTRDVRFDGRLFAGVRTTGVYCRPICPARTPKRENVFFYPTAAAAQEAGFRPCLRCRPESSPDLGAWRGTSNTVTRALALIEEGGLNGHAVDSLAERLGVGERQLRRLFKQHLGASPVAVAQTRRVLFARQLIAETRMPLAGIALAAGFGSVRRFNATFQVLYRRPPGDLRRAPYRGAGTLPQSPVVTLALPYARPYDWHATIDFLASRAILGVETVDDEGRYMRSVALDGAFGWIKAEHDKGAAGLRVTISFPRVTSLSGIVRRVRRVFDLAADPLAIDGHLSSDPLLAPLVARRPGLRVPGAWDGFELAMRAIVGQQIAVSAAAKLAGRLVAQHGTRLPGIMPPGLTHAFPSPSQLVSIDSRAVGMPGARVNALSSLAEAVIQEPALFGPSQSLDGAIERLRALPGIGEWTAQYIAMRALRECDAFPASDIGLLRAVANLTGRKPGPCEILARAEAWRPWRAYAALHLWTGGSKPAQPGIRPDNSSGKEFAHGA